MFGWPALTNLSGNLKDRFADCGLRCFFSWRTARKPDRCFFFFSFLSLSDPQFLLLDFQTRIIPLDERGIEHFLLDSLIPRTRSLRYMYGILYTLDPCSWPTFVRRTRESKGKRFRGFRTTSLIYSNKLARNLENKRDIWGISEKMDYFFFFFKIELCLHLIKKIICN